MNSSTCAFAKILNATLYLPRERDSSNSSFLDEASLLVLQEWTNHPPSTDVKMFLIPPVICLVAAVLVIPSILFVIFSSFSIRQETRYLLLGNTLLCDLIYLLFYTLSVVLNMANIKPPKYACVLLLFLLAVTYCGGLLTAVAMVLDTYLAVLFPLRYISILPYSRAKKVILLLWISSVVFPGIIFLVLWYTQKPASCTMETCSVPIILVLTLHGNDAVKFCYVLSVTALFLCLSLILCCYIILYYKTRQSGIWKSIFSRASITFLMHHTILFFYFSPLLALVVESLLYINDVIGLQTGIWVSLTICNVLMVLPKALSPYLYGLRYREISSSLKLIFRMKRLSLVSPVVTQS
ncbi:PREDICTED: probable G-protein coupled receptor 148 [Gavialis gangeticus]|uniref:probable G-protein coupled receptor 148 n=1 Tax=Gavialis gangeticus TaxID=94835 RepID=UPI00092F1A9B|nr:PREDICTED: probable G-protein coupled receptor 148 [Gavialis gangeticus]